MPDERELSRELMGVVAGGFGVATETETGTVRCARCANSLSASDRVVAVLREHGGGQWTTESFYCRDHDAAELPGPTSDTSTDQVLVQATLEPTGAFGPRGVFHPDALTLGAIELLEFSPATDGDA